MTLSDEDYQLSMRISPRSRVSTQNDGLRSLRVDRLRDADKAVLRLPLRRNIATADTVNAYQVHCEPCNDWFMLPEWGEEIRHSKCGRVYVLEFAVFSAIEEPEGE